ncbi:molybdate ABC transporter substrate-binding protein [Aerophototrophica crusticola]|uniref:Molybdate ABC transporter substrate-binding protein n=1 Tax=Aerophototrophica crusticola TaxID=1709002 RepID=A0A858R3W2_9PROT|nr:molybdate ABC transporter substrate-binding protein [Rhodospirillaceae bacterium B3]
MSPAFLRPVRRLLGAALLALGLAGGPPALAQAPPADQTVVFAAASLRNALDGIARQYQGETGKAVAISYAASSALARQIEAAAPAHIFIAADLDWMDYLEGKGLLAPGSRRTLLGNRLVLVAPKDSTAAVALGPGLDLTPVLGRDGRLALGDPASVPAGKYARAALEKLGAWDTVKGRLAPAENVRAALLLVSRGEAPAGIVYATDARADPSLKVLGTFPADSHPAILYPAALTAAGGKSADAAAFLAYLAGPKAKPLFEKEGFVILGN